MTAGYIPLTDRAVIRLSGGDVRHFLQGLVTQDVELLTPERAIYALLLTPQGKFLFDMFLIEREGEGIFMDVDAARLPELLKRLKMYRLRSKVEIEDVSGAYEAVALVGEGVNALIGADGSADDQPGSTRPFCKGVAYIDPRQPALGARAVIERENQYQSFHAYELEPRARAVYEELRIRHTVPDHHDMEPEGSFPLQYRMVECGAVSFTKGCYVGQEVTTRTHHRGKVRKTVFTVQAESGTLPEAGTAVMAGDKRIGELRSSVGALGLALLDSEAAQNAASVQVEGISLRVTAHP